jgi:hypothetical protein
VHSFIHLVLTHRLTLSAAKSQLTKANQTKIKMENLARELQKVRMAITATPTICTEVPLRTTNA